MSVFGFNNLFLILLDRNFIGVPLFYFVFILLLIVFYKFLDR